ncbi:hypothetical protein CAP35_07765 [Chitinophagaceae bacterium IBVUCB1]|nr:hypothetical protein CAP35_07765 [Chitinophagaceae bacterium IBVUCB1]
MRKIYFILLGLFIAKTTTAQIDSTLFRRKPLDSTGMLLNMDAVYNRPFLSVGKLPVALGGYVEANYQHLGTDGISEGHQFQMRRFTLFVASGISRRIKFLSEIEFEDGTKEINIEFAALDIEFHPLFNLRGGVIMNPIGAFNQNHDGPKWEFVDRPVSATQMLPATWSNVGFGIYGKQFQKDWVLAYEAYLTNGFNDKIIDNSEGKTFLPAAKEDRERFEESFNGVPLVTAKGAIRHKKIAEVGLSYMGGVYNKFQDDGLELDKRRRVDVVAIDVNSTLPRLKTFINAEWAWVYVDVPATYTQQYANRQRGGFADIVQPLYTGNLFGFNKSVINAAFRFEYVDYNVGRFNETGDNISDHYYAIVPAISWRPSPQTVLRFNYKYSWRADLLGNPLSKTAGVQIGFSSYF